MTSVRESSQLLMAVIEGLSTGGIARESEKERLMKKFESADQAVDQLVDEHHDGLTLSIRSYAKIGAHLNDSQQRVVFLKESLGKCKKLLHCKRDYLLKLWVKSREQREILKILDKIEEVKGIPEQISRHLSNKHYLLATQMVTANVKLLEGELESIEALRDLRTEMRRQKETLHVTLIDELHRHLYPVAAAKARRAATPDQRPSATGLPRPRSTGHSLNTSAFCTTPSTLECDHPDAMLTGAKALELIPASLADDMAHDPEEDSSHFMLILVESLAILNKLPETIDRINARMDTEFSKLVQTLTEEIAYKMEVQGDQVYFTDEAEQPGQQKFFLQLLRLAFERFQAVSVAQVILLGHLKASMLYRNVCVPLYTMAEVWSSVQYVLQALLGEYFDVKNSQSNRDASNFHSVSNLSQYFDLSGKKKPPQRRNKTLFAFDSSTIALSVQSNLTGDEVAGVSENGSGDNPPFKFLCKPNFENVTVVFNELQTISMMLKEILGIPMQQHCPLSEFVEDFVNTAYLNRIRSDTRDKVTAATEGSDAFKIVRTDDGGSKKAGPSKPISQGTVTIAQLFSRFRTLSQQLPMFRPQILDVVMGVLDMYRKSSLDSFRHFAKPSRKENLVLSASWTGNPVVTAAFLSFFSWAEYPASRMAGDAGSAANQPVSKVFSSSPHAKETEYINTFLAEDVADGESKLGADNIMSLSESNFTMLSCMQESLEWTYNCYRREEIRNDNCDVEEAARHEVLDELQHQVVELSQRVLIVLHIELRFQCVYHLHNILQRSNYVCRENDCIDPAILELNKCLSGVEEVLSAHLQPQKVKYLLSGLGHFLASLILDACQHIQSLNRHGIKKLCRMVFSLQQNLTNLTMAREVELDRARQYCELFHLHADELCKVILDHGRIFSDAQYHTALRLMISQGQCNNKASFSEYWAKVKYALAGRQTSSLSTRR